MAYKNSRPRTPGICPVCGEDVPPRALACPECGADHNSGWKEDADTTGALDLPDEDFNYDDFVKEEFGGGSQRGIKLRWGIVAAVLLAALIAGLAFSLF
ncbi:MAG: zinc-ribbon domain-containing protein [Verrucomicrobiota bacterium]